MNDRKKLKHFGIMLCALFVMLVIDNFLYILFASHKIRFNILTFGLYVVPAGALTMICLVYFTNNYKSVTFRSKHFTILAIFSNIVSLLNGILLMAIGTGVIKLNLERVSEVLVPTVFSKTLLSIYYGHYCVNRKYGKFLQKFARDLIIMNVAGVVATMFDKEMNLFFYIQPLMIIMLGIFTWMVLQRMQNFYNNPKGLGLINATKMILILSVLVLIGVICMGYGNYQQYEFLFLFFCLSHIFVMFPEVVMILMQSNRSYFKEN